MVSNRIAEWRDWAIIVAGLVAFAAFAFCLQFFDPMTRNVVAGSGAGLYVGYVLGRRHR